MTNFMYSLNQSSQVKMSIIKEAIARKVSVIQQLSADNYANFTLVLSAVEAVRRNLSYASS